MVNRRLVPLLTAVALLFLIGFSQPRAATGPVPGYCVYVSPPPAVPWGGATVCTP